MKIMYRNPTAKGVVDAVTVVAVTAAVNMAEAFATAMEGAAMVNRVRASKARANRARGVKVAAAVAAMAAVTAG